MGQEVKRTKFQSRQQGKYKEYSFSFMRFDRLFCLTLNEYFLKTKNKALHSIQLCSSSWGFLNASVCFSSVNITIYLCRYSSRTYTCIWIIFFSWESGNGQEKEENKNHTREPKANVSFFKFILQCYILALTKASLASWKTG